MNDEILESHVHNQTQRKQFSVEKMLFYKLTIFYN